MTMYLSARLYDAIYLEKDYASEVKRLHEAIEHSIVSDGKRLLDVACGTGQHLFFLQNHYQVEGLDINPEFISIAQKKLPDSTFHQGDMRNFALQSKYDVITCLFSSIGYVRDLDELHSTVMNMRRHLNPGGLLAIEPWYTPQTFKPGHFTAMVQDYEGGKVARTNHWGHQKGVSVGDSQFLIANSEGIQHIAEKHELCLFTNAQYQNAFEQAGLSVVYDQHGLIGRGLYVGISAK